MCARACRGRGLKATRSSAGPRVPQWGRVPKSCGPTQHAVSLTDTAVVGELRKAGSSLLAGRRAKAGTEIATQTHLTQTFATCTDFSAGGKMPSNSGVARGYSGQAMGGQGILLGTEPKQPPKGKGQRRGPCMVGQGAESTLCTHSPTLPEWPERAGRGGQS